MVGHGAVLKSGFFLMTCFFMSVVSMNKHIIALDFVRKLLDLIEYSVLSLIPEGSSPAEKNVSDDTNTPDV